MEKNGLPVTAIFVAGLIFAEVKPTTTTNNMNYPNYPNEEYGDCRLSWEEAMALPLKDRPVRFRISDELYHAVFEAVGTASVCWIPGTGDAVFDSAEAEKVALRLCLKIAEELEAAIPASASSAPRPCDS